MTTFLLYLGVAQALTLSMDVPASDFSAAACPGGPPCWAGWEAPAVGGSAWWRERGGAWEFGWTVQEPGGDPAHLRRQVWVDGAVVVRAAAGGARLVDASGRSWTVSAPVAVDGRGERLPAVLRPVAAGDGVALVVEVDARGAVWPVVIDPVVVPPVDLRLGGDAHAFGNALALVDLDQDGVTELAVGAPWRSAVSLYAQTEGWIAASPVQTLFYPPVDTRHSTDDPADPSPVLDFGLEGLAWDWGSSFGLRLCAPGDLDGDGLPELVVAWDYSLARGGTAVTTDPEGLPLVIYEASAAGLDSLGQTFIDLRSSLSNIPSYGDLVAVGDVNGDGYDDLAYGGPNYWRPDAATSLHGAVAVLILGGPSGISNASGQVVRLHSAIESEDWSAITHLSAAGDTNGDGLPDILWTVSAEDEDRSLLWLGDTAGLSASGAIALPDDGLRHLGAGGVGDVDGDGYQDLALITDEGGVPLLSLAYGSPAGPVSVVPLVELPSGGTFGVDRLGDRNGDGDEDFVVAVGPTASREGELWLFDGDSGGVPGYPTQIITGLGVVGVPMLGLDLDADGLGELLVGQPEATVEGADDAGALYVYAGVDRFDGDGDGYSVGEGEGEGRDCDDNDPLVGPIEGGFRDADGDGYGGEAGAPCEADLVAVAGDCDDASADIHPGAEERCDSADRDEDCDGLSDDLDPDVRDTVPVYEDRDGDGYGGAQIGWACDEGLFVGGDCDDEDHGDHPGAEEICDDRDNDCDGLIDPEGLCVAAEEETAEPNTSPSGCGGARGAAVMGLALGLRRRRTASRTVGAGMQ